TGQCPLITEALRGAGAVLRDLDGRPLMAGRHPRGDLAPRDVVAARVHEVMTGAGSRHVWLDATALGRDVLEDGFPTVTAACRKQGVDPVTGLIPVAPGAHYACGGIRADLDGRTSVPGLYAIGEAASTGVHGANRLASNSLVEAVITGRRAGALAGALAREPKRRAGDRTAEHGGAGRAAREGAGLGAAAASAGAEPAGAAAGGEGAPLSRPVLAAHMSRYAGVLRDAEGLRTLARILRGAGGAGGEPAWRVRATEFDLASLEAGNLRVVSALIAAAALRRAESRGAHRRGDAPGTAPGARHSLARWNGGDIDITWEDA
ncbi:MAG TPA: FAD-binding protein, partial [Trebonia sp.]|nr:FAD-binding protein [Trebonia sp.]